MEPRLGTDTSGLEKLFLLPDSVENLNLYGKSAIQNSEKMEKKERKNPIRTLVW